MKNEITIKIINKICENYLDTIMNGLETHPDEFIYTLSLIDFIVKLKEKNIYENLDNIFIDNFIDKIYIEANKYIERK